MASKSRASHVSPLPRRHRSGCYARMDAALVLASSCARGSSMSVCVDGEGGRRATNQHVLCALIRAWRRNGRAHSLAQPRRPRQPPTHLVHLRNSVHHLGDVRLEHHAAQDDLVQTVVHLWGRGRGGRGAVEWEKGGGLREGGQ